jgi:hypothetical protein
MRSRMKATIREKLFVRMHIAAQRRTGWILR